MNDILANSRGPGRYVPTRFFAKFFKVFQPANGLRSIPESNELYGNTCPA